MWQWLERCGDSWRVYPVSHIHLELEPQWVGDVFGREWDVMQPQWIMVCRVCHRVVQ